MSRSFFEFLAARGVASAHPPQLFTETDRLSMFEVQRRRFECGIAGPKPAIAIAAMRDYIAS